MLLISSPIPSICITPAPPVKNEPEPYSPFKSAEPEVDNDGYRANHLSLPPSTDTSPWHSSPLRPAGRPPRKGLTRDQFDSLLKGSRDTRARVGSQKVTDLRKELALKNQSPKQLERRARFLSKVNESSFIGTICVPEVTLELPEPATAHCFISPPVFESEHSFLEIAAENLEDLVVVNSSAQPGSDEQVVRGRLIAKKPLASSKSSPSMPNKSKRIPPSLDEISARLKPGRVSPKKDYSRSRLPNFLTASSLSPPRDDQIQTVPIRSLTPNDEMFDTTFAQQANSPRLPDACNLTQESRRAVTPHTVGVVTGPTIRSDIARDMVVILRRRSSPPPGLDHNGCARTRTAMRRCSAPAEMKHSGRDGFDHVAILSRGGF